MSSPYNWPTTNATPVHERKVVVDVALGWSIRVETLSSHWFNIVTRKTTQDIYQNYCPHGGWKLNSPTALDNRYNSLVVSIHYWKIHLDNFVSSNPSVANGCCCWLPGTGMATGRCPLQLQSRHRHTLSEWPRWQVTIRLRQQQWHFIRYLMDTSESACSKLFYVILTSADATMALSYRHLCERQDFM